MLPAQLWLERVVPVRKQQMALGILSLPAIVNTTAGCYIVYDTEREIYRRINKK